VGTYTKIKQKAEDAGVTIDATVSTTIAQIEAKVTAHFADAAGVTVGSNAEKNAKAIFKHYADQLTYTFASEQAAADLLSTDFTLNYESDVNTLLGLNTTDVSRERAAISSMIFNGGAGVSGVVGPKLRAALAGDTLAHRIDAWFEIRYASNGDQSNGIAKRRYLEAALFGLYEGNDQVAFAKALKAHFETITAYTRYPDAVTNLDYMQAYENFWSRGNELAVEFANANSTTLVKDIPFKHVFLPVASGLAEVYGLSGLSNPQLTTSSDYHEGQAILAAIGVITIDNEVVLGLETSGVIKATSDGNDLLIAVKDKVNELSGGVGDDILIGHNKGDSLDGGKGADVLIGNGGTDYLDGGEGNDTLYGGAGGDNLIGGSDNGNDYLDGGKGNDTMIGGDGDDTFIVQDSGDTIIELDGEGNDTIYSHTDFTLSDNSYVETLRAVDTESLRVEMLGSIDLTGNNKNNSIVGNSQDNILKGGEGDDILDGGTGNDTMYGGADDDTYVVDSIGDVVNEKAGEGESDLIISHINYTLKDDQDIEVLQLAEPSATSAIPPTNATGNALDNYIYGNSLHNILLGEGGEDTLYGGLGNDILYGGSDKDTLYGGLGIDTYFVNGSDVIYDTDGQGAVYWAVDGINDYSNRYTGGVFVNEDSEGNKLYESSGDTYKLTHNLELIINNGTVIQDFQNGELGIHLTTESGGDKKDPRPPTRPPRNPRPPSVDPIVLDLDGDGVETTPLTSYFDFNGDGFKTLSGFAHSDDGLLVLDINSNGFADNGRELFGDSTVLSNGNIALHGFEALMAFDHNEDGVIDQHDDVFSELLVWQDINGDAVSQEEEMFSLADLGIASFNLDYQDDGQVVNGNTYAFSSYYTKVNGEVSDVSAVFFGANNQYSYYSPDVDIPDRLKDLPDILGTGSVYSLRVAMTLDETGQLEQLVRDYINDSSLHTKAQLTKIIGVWAGTDYTDNDYVFKLRSLEQLFGGRVLDTSRGAVNRTFDNYLNYFNDSFARYGFLRDFFSSDVYDIDTNMWLVDDFNAYFESYFKALTVADPLLAAQQQKELFESELARFQLPTVYNVALLDGSRLVLDSGLDGSLQGSEYGDFIDGRAGDDEIHAGDGDDVIEARSGDDVAYDEKGNDKINLHEGNDTAFNGEGNDVTSLGDGDDTYNAGAGSDTVLGGKGNDIYIYDRDFDHDIIQEGGGKDVLRFTEGLTQSDVTFARTGNNLVISINANKSRITLEGFFSDADYGHGYGSQYRIENFEFSDGSVVTAESLLTLYAPVVPRNIYGTEGDDDLVGHDGVDQTLEGDKGNDTLVGGLSNDTLKGEEGSDTYLFSSTTGHDKIREDEGQLGDIDTILIGIGITPDDVQLLSTEGGLLLQTSDGSNSLLIDWADNQSSIEQVVFESGVVWDSNTIVQKTVSVSNLSDYWLGDNVGKNVGENVDLLAGDDIAIGTDGDDVIAGNVGNDQLNGGEGSDTLVGGEGDDRLEGGEGDDSLYGGEGDDYLSGGDGVDTLSGGLGNDTLQGNTGNDVYLFGHGEGSDTIHDGSGSYGNKSDNVDNIVRFKADVTSEQVSFSRIHNDLIITLTAPDDSESHIAVSQWFYATNYYVSQLAFDNGAVITKEQILAIVSQPTEGDNYLVDTTNENTVIDGLAGDDVIKVGSGDDEVTGGEGNDTINLGKGKNTFHYALGDGEDRIRNDVYRDHDNGEIRVDSYDTIKFGAGISLANLNITKTNNYNDNIEFTFTGHDGKVIVESVQSPLRTFFRYVEFEDGSVLNINQIWQRIEQVEPSPIDTGRVEHTGGADVFLQDNVNEIDVYTLSVGFGVANIKDTNRSFDVLRFKGEDFATLSFYREGSDLHLFFADTGDQVVIPSWFLSASYPIARIEFSDGVVLEKTEVNRLADLATELPHALSLILTAEQDEAYSGDLVGTDRSDTLIASDEDDNITGGLGNDLLKGGAGNDSYHFSAGFGKDEIADLVGENTIQFDHTISASDIQVSRSEHHLFINMVATNDQIIVRDWYVSDNAQLTVVFNDGSQLSAEQLSDLATLGTPFADYLIGDDADNVITGGAGNDHLSGQKGTDVYRFSGDWGEDLIDEVADGSVNIIQFTDGISAADISLSNVDGNLLISQMGSDKNGT
jgi:Ca2+-binding RTX toxin-like protein